MGCKAVYPNQASAIAQELINGGCTRLAMIEAGNQLPNAAPFPARPPPPPPLLYPAQGVGFKKSGSPECPTSSEPAEHVHKCEDGHASEWSDQQMTEKPQVEKDVSCSIAYRTMNGRAAVSLTAGVHLSFFWLWTVCET